MKLMNGTTIAISLGALGTIVAVLACSPNPNKSSVLPPSTITTTKPTSVSAGRVSVTAMAELSHIERAIKSVFGPQDFRTDPADVPAGSGCVTTTAGKTSMWETKWNCGLNSKLAGKKEIEGEERVDYDQAASQLIYRGSFQTRNYDDVELREKAHTLETGRNIVINLSQGFTTAKGTASFVLRSQAVLSAGTGTADGFKRGSNWKVEMSGILSVEKGVWTVSNVEISFDGILFGTDSLRKTEHASGSYKYASRSIIELKGLGDDTCTKPVGTWELMASGGGEKVAMSVRTSEGSVETAGVAIGWPFDLCGQP